MTNATPAIPPLLPEGLRDRLPEEAEAASRVMRALIDVFATHGYRRVAPPIAEFRETLATDGDAAANSLLRFTDPLSRRTLAIRPDITRQVGRIATSSMAAQPRPLRLCYAGQVAKLAASTLWPEREMMQIGAELIGSDAVTAVCEIAKMAVDALAAAGVADISVDLTLPDLVDTLAAGALPLPDGNLAAVRAALDAKDAGALPWLGASAYLPLLAATGDFDTAIERLAAIDAQGVLTSRIATLRAVNAAISGIARVTLDPTERHGFEYQSGIGFSFFAQYPADAQGRVGAFSIGRGGSYAISHADGGNEPAVGFSLYPDPLIMAGLGNSAGTAERLFLPIGHDVRAADALRTGGWVTIAAISDADDPRALGCTHILHGDNATKL